MKGNLNVKVISGDISTVPSGALITAINGSGLWFGGIDNVIVRTSGNQFHQDLSNQMDQFQEGKSFFIRCQFQPQNSFQNVIFVIDNLIKKLHEIILSGLMEAEKQELSSVTLPTIRMGVMLGVVEKSEDEVLDEVILALEMFNDSQPVHVKEITFVIYSNPEFRTKLSIFI